MYASKATTGGETMKYSYGDLWHIISTIVTRYELILNNIGLYIRVALQRVISRGTVCSA